MRPYLAILKDSFREALSSRVLLLTLGLSTLVLLAIAPISLEERRAAFLVRHDILAPESFAVLLRRTAETKNSDGKPKESPARRVWERFDSSDREAYSRLPLERKDDQYPHWQVQRISENLNEMLLDASLYDAEAWANVKLTDEAKEFIDRGAENLEHEEIARLNRLLLEAAFPKHIRRSVGTDLYIGYLHYEYPGPISIGMSRRAIVGQALATFTDWFLGFLGVFVAILVTASIIPNTFEPGAIDLLLSKPVARPLLFLSKFAGGCIFVAVTAGYLIFGLWLIVGLRLDWWHHRLLLCIPLLLFLFAIYYGVSALAGLFWRNTIICVVMTIMFWFVCWVFGGVKLGIFDFLVMEPSRIMAIVPAGETLIAQNKSAQVLAWNEGRWDNMLEGGNAAGGMAFFMPFAAVVPIYDPKEDRLLSVDNPEGGFPFNSASPVLSVARRKEEWRKVTGPDVPTGVSKLFVRADGRIVAVGTTGIHVLSAPADRPTPKIELGKFSIKIPFVNDPFTRVSPDDWNGAQVIDMDQATGAIAATDDRQRLGVLVPDDKGRYVWRERQPAPADTSTQKPESQVVALAIAGSTILTGLANGAVQVFDAKTLDLRAEYPSDKGDGVRQIVASPKGRYFAVLLHNQRLWLYDAQEDASVSLPLSHQGEISAVAFLDADRLAVAHSYNSISEYSIESASHVERHDPELSTAEKAYWYLVKPLYTIFPKPSELKNLVQYLLTGKETVEWGEPGDRQNPNTRAKLDVWGPLWSNAAFLAVMLGLGCLYIYRREF